MCTSWCTCIYTLTLVHMQWLQVVGSLNLQVSFAKEPYERDDILQKRPKILRRLLIIGAPKYTQIHNYVCLCIRIHKFVYTNACVYLHTYTSIYKSRGRAVCCSVLQCDAVCCSEQCVAVCCSVMQCVAVSSVLQCVTSIYKSRGRDVRRCAYIYVYTCLYVYIYT